MGYCTRVGTFGTESAVRKRGGSRNLPYLNAKPRQIPLLGTYARTGINSMNISPILTPNLKNGMMEKIDN